MEARCPNCHTILVVDEDLETSEIIVCHECGGATIIENLEPIESKKRV